MKHFNKKSIAKFASMLILSVMLVAVPVGMSRNSTVTADAAAAIRNSGSSESVKSFGCSSGFDIRSIMGITRADEQSNTAALTSDKNACTQNSAQSKSDTSAKTNAVTGNTCTTAANSRSACQNNNTCAGNTCTGNTCTGNTCTGNTCTGNTYTGNICTGNTCNRTQSLSDFLNSLKSQIQTGTKTNTTTTTTKPSGSTCPSGNCGQTTQTNPKNNNNNTTTTSPNKGNTTTTTTTTTTPTTSSSASDYEKQVVTLVNKERAKYGLTALTMNEKLGKMARAKSQDMHDNNYFSHTSPKYGSPFEMMKTFGISYKTAGENIAMGYKTPAAVVEGWMNSSGHRANILNANFKQIGVGYIADGNYWTQEFIG